MQLVRVEELSTLSDEVTSSTQPPTSSITNYSSGVLGAALCILILLATLGNLLVCIAVVTDKSLRKLSNLFFVSLALSDLLVGAVVMPLALINDLSAHGWRFGQDFCKIWIASDVMCSTASILNLMAISFDRYVHIKDPLQYTEWITRKSVPVAIGATWIVSGLISFLPISLDLHVAPETTPPSQSTTLEPGQYLQIRKRENATESNGSYSFYDYEISQPDQLAFSDSKSDGGGGGAVPPVCQLDFGPVYSFCSSIVSFFLPCVVMLIIYFHLFAIARRHAKSINANNTPSTTLSAVGMAVPLEVRDTTAADVKSVRDTKVTLLQPPSAVSVTGAGKARNSSSACSTKVNLISSSQRLQEPLLQEHKAAITIGIIMGVFLLCWTPFFIVNVVAGFCKECISPTTFQVLTWLGYSNSAFNPVIYTIFNAEFREAFKRLLTEDPRQCCATLVPSFCHYDVNARRAHLNSQKYYENYCM